MNRDFTAANRAFGNEGVDVFDLCTVIVRNNALALKDKIMALFSASFSAAVYTYIIMVVSVVRIFSAEAMTEGRFAVISKAGLASCSLRASYVTAAMRCVLDLEGAADAFLPVIAVIASEVSKLMTERIIHACYVRAAA